MQANSRQEAVEESLMVEMAKRGDEAAFGQLWLRHPPAVVICGIQNPQKPG
jgi:hypothetical protein